MEFQIDKPITAEQLEAYYELRWRILRAPWNQSRGSERDEFEEVADHVTALDESGRIIGVGRLQLNSASEAQIRFMAVEADCRGCGVGRAIVARLETLARGRQVERIVLNAREEVVGFYARLGYEIVGAGPTLFDEVAHAKMAKVWGD
ncbi:MAG: GNAT family N-acetyltransferase [Bythopirellula sp.]